MKNKILRFSEVQVKKRNSDKTKILFFTDLKLVLAILTEVEWQDDTEMAKITLCDILKISCWYSC